MKKNIFVVFLVAVLCLFASCVKITNSTGAESVSVTEESTGNSAEISLDTLDQQISYAMGVYYAQLSNYYYSIDAALFGQGALDYANDELRMTEDEQAAAFADYFYTDNLTLAEEYLEENAKKDGVIVTESGLQYKITAQSNGIQAKKGDSVNVDYTLTLIDGTVVDSGEGVDFTLEDGALIEGFLEGMLVMNVGSSATFYVHPDLGYGKSGSYTIEPYALLIFDVTLNAINE